MAALSVESGSRREIHWHAFLSTIAFECFSQFTVGRHSPGDEKRSHIVGADRSQSFADEIFDHGALKRSDKIESLPIASGEVIFELRLGNIRQSFAADFDGIPHAVNLNVAQHGSLDSAVRKVKARAIRVDFFLSAAVPAIAMFDLGWLELHGVRVAMRREPVNDRASGITQAKQFGDFVESLAGCVIASVADIFVGPTVVVLLGQIKMRVPSRHHQSQYGKLQLVIALLPLFQQNRMDVAFEMIDRNQRLVEGEGQSLGIADAHQQRSGKAGALRDGDRVDGVVSLVGLSQRLANDGNDRAQMLARCQVRAPLRHKADGWRSVRRQRWR